MAFPALKHSEGSGSTEVDVDFLKANTAAPGERDALQISKISRISEGFWRGNTTWEGRELCHSAYWQN